MHIHLNNNNKTEHEKVSHQFCQARISRCTPCLNQDTHLWNAFYVSNCMYFFFFNSPLSLCPDLLALCFCHAFKKNDRFFGFFVYPFFSLHISRMQYKKVALFFCGFYNLLEPIDLLPVCHSRIFFHFFRCLKQFGGFFAS